MLLTTAVAPPHTAQALSEFVGTFLFLFLAFGIANSASQQALISNTQAGTSTAGGLDPSALLLSATGVSERARARTCRVQPTADP